MSDTKIEYVYSIQARDLIGGRAMSHGRRGPAADIAHAVRGP